MKYKVIFRHGKFKKILAGNYQKFKGQRDHKNKKEGSRKATPKSGRKSGRFLVARENSFWQARAPHF